MNAMVWYLTTENGMTYQYNADWEKKILKQKKKLKKIMKDHMLSESMY